MTDRDMARFGLLYLRKGNWNGKQIIPQEWVEKSTQAYSSVNEEMGVGYGYMWNVVKPGTPFSNMLFDGRGGFYHTGIGIHTLCVLPELKAELADTRDLKSPREEFRDFSQILYLPATC